MCEKQGGAQHNTIQPTLTFVVTVDISKQISGMKCIHCDQSLVLGDGNAC